MWQVKEIIACLFILADGGIVATDCCGQYSFWIGVLVGMPGFFIISDAFRNADKYEKENCCGNTTFRKKITFRI